MTFWVLGKIRAELPGRPVVDGEYGGQGRERIQAALVLASRGRRDRFESMLQLLRMDWRDVLMAGGVGHDDWRAVLDRELGVPNE